MCLAISLKLQLVCSLSQSDPLSPHSLICNNFSPFSCLTWGVSDGTDQDQTYYDVYGHCNQTHLYIADEFHIRAKTKP